MLDRIKRAYYRRHFGEARAATILQAERELTALPRRHLSREWTDRFWSLPEEAWLPALALERDRVLMLEQRDFAVRAITRKNRLLAMLERPDESVARLDIDRIRANAEIAVERVERIKSDAMILEERVRAGTRAFQERFGSPP